MSNRKQQAKRSAVKRLPIRRRKKKKQVSPQPTAQYSAKSAKPEKPKNNQRSVPLRNDRTAAVRNRALAALGRMRREKLSLSEACRQEHIKSVTFLRYVGKAVRRDKPGGPFRPTAGDTFRRDLQIPTALGPTTISVYGSKNAQFISNYLNAVAAYLRTGDTELRPAPAERCESEGRCRVGVHQPDRWTARSGGCHRVVSGTAQTGAPRITHALCSMTARS